MKKNIKYNAQANIKDLSLQVKELFWDLPYTLNSHASKVNTKLSTKTGNSELKIVEN